MLALHAKLILVEIRVDERHVENAMGDQVDLLLRHIVDVLQDALAAFAHHHETRRKDAQLLQHPALIRARRSSRIVCRVVMTGIRKSRRSARMKLPARAAVNSVLVLEADHVGGC